MLIKSVPILLLLFFMSLLSSSQIFAEENEAVNDKQISVSHQKNVIDRYNRDKIGERLSVDQISDLARRGCCSHHGGVCGCDKEKNRIVCCDGTYSPSCTCSGY